MSMFRLSQGGQGGRSLDTSKLEAAYVGFHKLFNNRLGKAASVHKAIATVVETDNVLDRQVWVTNTPKMRRWVGDKTLHKLRAESHPVVTQPHEASVEIPKHDILNDRLGLWKPKINDLADGYDWALDELAVTMYAAGIAGVALGTTYDGQNLVDTDHTALSVGGTSQSNKVTGAFTAAKYAEAWTKYLGLVDENGVPINVAGRRMKLVVGPAWREVARDIVDQQTQANGEQNMDRGTADLIVTPWISARTVNVLGVSVTLTGLEWFMIPEGSSAVLIHVKRTPEFLSVEEGEFAFRTGKYLYGIEAEFGAAYGLWQEVVGGPGS
jgi:phage major head subunit gpT-like protein